MKGAHSVTGGNVLRLYLFVPILLLAIATGCPPGAEPQASFVLDPEDGAAPLQIEFADTSRANGSAISSWAWDFGDGVVSDMAAPTHTYTAPGTYTVTLTVSNAFGSDIATREIVVAGETGAPVAPSAAFRVIYDPLGNPYWRAFEDRSDPGSEPIIEWRWDFGDGEISGEPNPQHTYSEAGRYWVSLVVRSRAGYDMAVVRIAVDIPEGDPDGPGGWVSEHHIVPPRPEFIDLELIAFHDPNRGDFGLASCRDCHGKRFYEWAEDETTRAAHALMPEYGYRDERCVRCHNLGEDLLFRSTKYFRAGMFEAGSCATAWCHGPNGQKPLYMVSQ